MAIDNLPNGSDESPLSGAYIRTLVKQLAPTKPPSTPQNFIHNNINNNNNIIEQYKQPIPQITTSKKGDKLGMAKPNNPQNGHKKQVRRRLHTSRPYQERLLNMAEARKEIVTALKYHRAAMKQASEQRRQQPLDAQQHQRSIFGVQDYGNNSNVKKHESDANNVGLVENFCYYPSSNNSSNNNNHSNSSSSYSWGGVSSTALVEPPIYESLINLPNQTLGLNLNLQAFTNLDTTNFCHSINNSTNKSTPSSFKFNNNNNINNNSFPSSIMSPSSSSSSTPRDLIGVGTTTINEVVGPTCGMMHNDMYHPALDEEEIAEIRSIGEQHQIEWDDTLNLMKSAWWLKYLKKVEIGNEIKGEEKCYYNNYNNSELMDFPPWLSVINDQSLLLQQHVDDSCSEDTTLPWMDIGDIDGLDDEWLS